MASGIVAIAKGARLRKAKVVVARKLARLGVVDALALVLEPEGLPTDDANGQHD